MFAMVGKVLSKQIILYNTMHLISLLSRSGREFTNDKNCNTSGHAGSSISF